MSRRGRSAAASPPPEDPETAEDGSGGTEEEEESENEHVRVKDPLVHFLTTHTRKKKTIMNAYEDFARYVLRFVNPFVNFTFMLERGLGLIMDDDEDAEDGGEDDEDENVAGLSDEEIAERRARFVDRRMREATEQVWALFQTRFPRFLSHQAEELVRNPTALQAFGAAMNKAFYQAHGQDIFKVSNNIITYANDQASKPFSPVIPPNGKNSVHRGLRQLRLAELRIPCQYYADFAEDPDETYARMLDDQREDHIPIELTDVSAMFYSDPASCCQDENHTSGGLFESNVFVKTLRVIYQGPKSADKSAPGAAKVKPGPAAVNKVASVSASMAAYTHMHVCWALDDKDHWAHDCDIVAVQYAWFTVVDMLDTNMDDDNSKWARGLLDIITAKIFITPPTSKLVTRGKNGGLNCLPSRRKRQMALQDDPHARARSVQARSSVKGKTRERDTTPRRPVSSRAPLTPIQAPQLSPVQSGRSHSPDGETGRGSSASSPTPMPPPRHRVTSNETRSPVRRAAPNAPRAANSQRTLPASATWSSRETRSRTREASQPVASSSTVVASSGVSNAKRKHRD